MQQGLQELLHIGRRIRWLLASWLWSWASETLPQKAHPGQELPASRLLVLGPQVAKGHRAGESDNERESDSESESWTESEIEWGK